MASPPIHYRRVGSLPVWIAAGLGLGCGASTPVQPPPECRVDCGTPPPANPGSWSAAAPIPTARKEIANATVAVDGLIYVAGGIDRSGAISPVVERYDPTSDRWTTVAPLPDPVWRAAAAALDGRLYLFGGYRATGAFPFDPTDKTFVYDPSDVTWTERAPLPAARGAGLALATGGRVHVLGGAADAALARHDIYDPATDTWSAGPNVPTPRSGLTGAVMQGRLYVAGGYVLNGGVVSQQVIEVFDPAAGAWTRGPDLPETRHGVAATALAGRVYVFGGLPTATTSRTLELDPATGRWRQMADMPTPVSFMGAAAVGETAYVIGGGPVNLNRFDAVSNNRRFVP